jgi:hypothetical protein
MTLKDVFGLLSLLLSVVSYVPYVHSIFVANTKPHAFTWLVWGTVMAIAFVAQLSDKAGAGSWATGLSAAFCLSIGIIALFRGEKHITRGDWIAFVTTFLAIPLWVATSDPLWSVLLVTGIDTVAYYPTFRKSYAKPDEELAFKYVLTVVRYLFSLLALEHYTIVTSVYQFVSILMEISIVVMLLWRRAVLKKVVHEHRAGLRPGPAGSQQ